MKAQTDLVMTLDRKRVVPLGHPDGYSLYPIARAGEEVPEWAAKLMTEKPAEKPVKKIAAKESGK